MSQSLKQKLPKSKFSRFITAFLATVLFLSLITTAALLQLKPTEPEVFIGVMVGFATVDEVITFVDKVENYVNLIIISELNITTNATELYRVFDYLSSKGIYFIPFMTLFDYIDDPNFFQVVEQRWNKYFLGVYTFDEPGGKQIDLTPYRPVAEAKNYTDAAQKFVEIIAQQGLTMFANKFNDVDRFTIFTSDYALFWFDYSACYSRVLAEYGWNQSSQLNTALCRGAASAYNESWGSIVTWTYRHPPYLETPQQMYEDMVLAYNNGAKYIVVFNFPTNVTEYGVLTEDHLERLQTFWNYHLVNPQPQNVAEVAYVLPKDYGYGFRGPEDKIWGLWGPDELSSRVWNDVLDLLEKYGTKLDIIYENAEPSALQRYKELFYWNGTQISNG